MAQLILTTDTATTGIDKYNNMLTGGTFDIDYMPWTPYSGYSITKRDDLNPNVGITNDTTPGGFLLAGALNSGFTSSTYSTIFAGTGNTIDYFNNKIFAGENNGFNLVPYFDITNSNGVNFEGSSVIMGGQKNVMSGTTFPSEISAIMNGSGNSIINTISVSNYSDDFKRNTIINGISNSISGTVGNSWIGNGSGNSIYTTSNGRTKGNFILNGHNNKISSSLYDGSNYNTIIGGYNNSITNQNNSIVIGSNLVGSANTTSVNNLFFTDKMFANNYAYSSYTISQTENFDHANKTIGIIKAVLPAFPHSINHSPYALKITLKNGSYNGQILYLIGIPDGTVGSYTYNIILNSSNVISLSATTGYMAFGSYNYITLNNICSNIPIGEDATYYTGLGIFIWDAAINCWVRADYRGGI